MAEYNSTTAVEEKAAVISDSEGEEDDNIVENLDSPHSTVTLPSEVWAMVINCE